MKYKCTPILVLILSTMLFTPLLQAQSDEGDLYDINPITDGLIIGGSILTVAVDKYILQQEPTLTVSDIAALDSEDIWSWDRPAVNYYSTTATAISDRFRDGIGFMPLFLLLSKRVRKESGDIGVMYLQTFAVNSALTLTTKTLVSRERPFVYNDAAPLKEKQESNAERSFFSGHTSNVAAISFFTASVYEDFFPESNYRYVVWAGAIAVPAITAYTRVKGGHHFPSDVIVGYGVGALVGYLVPHLHRKKVLGGNVNLFPSQNGLGVVVNLN